MGGTDTKTVEYRTDNTVVNLLKAQIDQSNKMFSEMMKSNEEDKQRSHELYEGLIKQYGELQETTKKNEEKNLELLKSNIQMMEEFKREAIESNKNNLEQIKGKEEQIMRLMQTVDQKTKEFEEYSRKLEQINEIKAQQEEKLLKANADFEEEKERNSKAYTDQLLKTLEEREMNYLKNEFSKYDFNQIISLLNEIFVIENFTGMSEQFIEINASNKSFNLLCSMKHLNIALGGKTGVGKSTLINRFLQLDSSYKAKTGLGKPVTKGKPKEYTSDSVPTFRLWDTQGIEINEYGIKAVVDDLTNLVNTKAKENNPDTFIHAIWYCVSTVSQRFEDIELDSLLQLMKIYDGNKIPIIVVLTQSYEQDDATSMIELIKNNMPKSIDIIPVVANTKLSVEPYGLEELLELTSSRASAATNSACFHSIKLQMKDEIIQLENRLIQTAEANSKQTIIKRSKKAPWGWIWKQC